MRTDFVVLSNSFLVPDFSISEVEAYVKYLHFCVFVGCTLRSSEGEIKVEKHSTAVTFGHCVVLIS